MLAALLTLIRRRTRDRDDQALNAARNDPDLVADALAYLDWRRSFDWS